MAFFWKALANMVRSLINDLPLSFAIEPVAIGFVNILLMSHVRTILFIFVY